MSETSAAEEDVKAPAKTRSPIERLVVWGGIILLGVVVFVEYSGQKNYNAAMSWLEENEYNGKSLADVREAVVGASESDVEIKASQVPKLMQGNADVPSEVGKSFRWMSLFKKYELVVSFQGDGDDALLTGFYNPESLKQVEEEMAAKFADDEIVERPEDLGISRMNMDAGSGNGSSGDEEKPAEGDGADSDSSEEPKTEE